jgi:cell wall-associated NlpC family hydrolase
MMTRGARRLAARLFAVAILVSASLGSVTLSAAAPSQEDVRRAKDRLEALNRDLSLLVERYNQARIRLNDVQVRLTEVRLQAERAQAEAERAIGSLNRSAARAFTGFGSQFAVLLDATSLGDFSDRLEFIGSMAEADADLATQAELARQEARWTADELRAAVEQRRQVLDELATQKEQIDARVDQARALYTELDRQYHEALAAARAAAAAEAAAQQQSTGGGSGGGGSFDVSPIPPPPAPNGNVAAVLDAAYSVIGTPYQWGGSSPQTGFDCSGFTMWAWAHAGVSLPHSSAAQYSSLPHVAREDVQAGDLLFFYSPISHVGIYVGGGRMIHSPHTGSVVSVVSVYWDSFTGAARPG